MRNGGGAMRTYLLQHGGVGGGPVLLVVQVEQWRDTLLGGPRHA